MTLANIYAPNEHQDTFIEGVIGKLLDFKSGQLILGGDFNIPLIPSVDTRTGTSSIPTSPLKRIAKTLHRAQLIDVWRLQHSGERDYTFYSNPHKTYTRIYFFLISHTQLHAVQNTVIGNRTWSDHAPIFLTYALSQTLSQKHRFWCLNESLLQIPEVLTDVTKELNLYFQTNNIPGCDPNTLWEAHKVVIRGVLVKHGSPIKQECNEQLSQLLQKLSVAEARHKHAPSPASESELTLIHNQITDLLQYRAKAAIQICRGR